MRTPAKCFGLMSLISIIYLFVRSFDSCQLNWVELIETLCVYICVYICCMYVKVWKYKYTYKFTHLHTVTSNIIMCLYREGNPLNTFWYVVGPSKAFSYILIPFFYRKNYLNPYFWEIFEDLKSIPDSQK